MKKKWNVLWIMSDQHNASCTSCAGHPTVKTPHIDRIAARGIQANRVFCQNPICGPSRISFMTGQYPHTHGCLGNYNHQAPSSNPNTLSSLFRRSGYQTALIGKSHVNLNWDKEGFEHIRYCDLCDADPRDPRDHHYFKYLIDQGVADFYEEGTPKKNQEDNLIGGKPAQLPYEHSIERFTGNEAISFLEHRDETRPFFMQLSFQRPHEPYTPAKEHFDWYDPADIELPDSAKERFENHFATKPSFLTEPLKDWLIMEKGEKELKQFMASYFALISVIDMEIGRVLDQLEKQGELENTVILYTSDHGDFAGEHGLSGKNFGILDSIQRIPFVLSWPGGPQGAQTEEIFESVDWYPTVCELCNVPIPRGVDGKSIVPVLLEKEKGKEAAFCETGTSSSSICTKKFRLVYYAKEEEGELYDLTQDPGEINNLWNNKNYFEIRMKLLEQLLAFTMQYRKSSNHQTDMKYFKENELTASLMVQFGKVYWSDLMDLKENTKPWPPKE